MFWNICVLFFEATLLTFMRDNYMTGVGQVWNCLASAYKSVFALQYTYNVLSKIKINIFYFTLSKNSTLISQENCRFFLGWKTRENIVVLDILAVDNFDFTRKIVKKYLGEKLVKMLGFCQNWIFGQKFDFLNSVWLYSFHGMRTFILCLMLSGIAMIK